MTVDQNDAMRTDLGMQLILMVRTFAVNHYDQKDPLLVQPLVGLCLRAVCLNSYLRLATSAAL